MITFSKKKLELAVLLSTFAIPDFADMLLQRWAKFPGSLAKPVLVVGFFQAEVTISSCNSRVGLVYEKRKREKLQLGSIGKGKGGREAGGGEWGGGKPLYKVLE